MDGWNIFLTVTGTVFGSETLHLTWRGRVCTGTVFPCSREPILPVELAGLVAQIYGHAAPGPEVMACDGHHGASRLWPSDGAEGHHRRVL